MICIMAGEYYWPNMHHMDIRNIPYIQSEVWARRVVLTYLFATKEFERHVMKSKTFFPGLIVCLLFFFAAPASAWSLFDGIQQAVSPETKCEISVIASDEGQSSEGEGAQEEEEPDCE